MNKKIKVAIIFGGRSAEHEVSLQSAKSIIAAIDKEKYDIRLIGIDKSGKWYLNENSHALLNEKNPALIQLNKSNTEVTFITSQATNQMLDVSNGKAIDSIDVAFPILHGTFGEDGTIQGFLKMMNIPFVGVSVLASSVGMDKDVTKRLLRDAGIKIAPYITVTKKKEGTGDGGRETEAGGYPTFEEVVGQLGLPFFIKPANAGSSVGVHKVITKEGFQSALNDAFQFDRKLLIEENVSGREIECAVLGNADPIASIPGEVIPQGDFYSYKAKYIDEKGAILEAPAKLTAEETKRVQETSIKAFKVLCCEGLSRVDFFLRPNGDLILNEINTMPGFTSISMYPRLWQLSGISYPELIDRLISLAIERHREEAKLKTDFS